MSSKEETLLTQEFVEQTFSLNRETGQIFWKKPKRREYLGKEIGCYHHAGYRQYRVLKYSFLVHRLVFFMVHGVWPIVCDHIDGNSKNNKPENLRSGTTRQNAMNKRMNRESGHLVGTSQNPSGRWRALISIKGKIKALGTHETQEQAHHRYVEELTKLGESLVA